MEKLRQINNEIQTIRGSRFRLKMEHAQRMMSLTPDKRYKLDCSEINQKLNNLC